MSEVFDPEKVERWDCQAGGFLDGGTVAVMVGAEDGEYVYAWQYRKLLALYREAAHANKLMARTVSDLLVWRKNPEAFTESTS